jgi:hypothetical protein
MDLSFVHPSINFLSKMTLVLCCTISTEAMAKTYTLNDVKAREVQESTEFLNDFVQKIEETVKKSLKENKESSSSLTVINLPPAPYTGPKLVPFSQITRKKQVSNVSNVSMVTIEQLLIENNKKVSDLICLIRGGFTLGFGMNALGKIIKVGRYGKNILDDVLSSEKDQEQEKSKEISKFADVLSKIGPYLPVIVLLVIFYPKLRTRIPDPIQEYLPFYEPKNKSFLTRVWKGAVNFNTPTPYIIIGVTFVGGAFLILKKSPESQVASMLNKMIDATNKNISSFTSLGHKLFEDNMNRFKDAQKMSEESKDLIIKDLKKRADFLEKDNKMVRDHFHKLELAEVKTKHLLEDCASKTQTYEVLFNQQKDYYLEEVNNQNSLSNNQKSLTAGDNNTPFLSELDEKKLRREKMEVNLAILDTKKQIMLKYPNNKYVEHLNTPRITLSSPTDNNNGKNGSVKKLKKFVDNFMENIAKVDYNPDTI